MLDQSHNVTDSVESLIVSAIPLILGHTDGIATAPSVRGNIRQQEGLVTESFELTVYCV